jgi:hypothetical protein
VCYGARDPRKMEEETLLGINLKSKLDPGANKIFFYFFKDTTDLNAAHREQHFKHL